MSQQPTEAEILAALASYKQHIVEHNKKVFKALVHLAETEEPPSDWTDEEIAEARREFMLYQLEVLRPEKLATGDARRINAPRDVLKRWEDLVAIPELALDGTGAGWGVDAARRTVLREQYRAGIEAALQQLPEPPSPLFPCDFSVLMEHIDGLEGAGWPQYRQNGGCGVSFWDGLGEMQDTVMARVWTDGEKLKDELVEPTWDVLCGWECGQGPSAKCYVVYFRDEAKERPTPSVYSRDPEKPRPWGWRYVILVHTSLWAFDNVVDLLDFYKTFNEPELEKVEDFIGMDLWGGH